MSHFAFSVQRDDERTLVAIFLRGAADGLSLVPPVGDDDYYRARPRIAVSAQQAPRLDGFFALHPCLRELAPLFHDGRLAVVHAAGSEEQTRSHFEAQDLMEHGGAAVSGGWLGRLLRARRGESGPLDAIALGAALPESLRGAPSATALRALADLDPGGQTAAWRGRIATLYANDPLLGAPALGALNAAARIAELRRTVYQPAPGTVYAGISDGDIAHEFSAQLAQVAQLIKARVGLAVACVDLGGWDSHFVQGQIIEPRMRALAQGLAAFAADLGPRLATTSVVVMSEFGRRVRENSSLGTDHGRGGTMLVLGGGTPGGMHCRWPGLHDEALDGPGDVPVAHNYRDVLAPLVARHGVDPATVFPGFPLAPLPL